MNRRQATPFDDTDSDSDWDSTIAESLQKKSAVKGPARPSSPSKDDPDSRINSKVSKPTENSDEENRVTSFRERPNTAGNVTLRNIDLDVTENPQKSESSLPARDSLGLGSLSPPPHINSFKSALNDFSGEPIGCAPDIPPRRYDQRDRGGLYTVPESDIVDWNDSDADERVLKELQQNLEKEKQKYSVPEKERDKKVTIVVGNENNGSASGDDTSFVKSPNLTKSIEQSPDSWSGTMLGKLNKTLKKPKTLDKSVILEPKPGLEPGTNQYLPAHSIKPIQVTTNEGKKCILYFNEGNPHYLEVIEDNADAFLPTKIDEIEKLFRRVWREIFAALRIVTCFFVLFITELVHFLVHHITRPLVVDSLSSVGNFLVKPVLTICFNFLIQPVVSFVWNITSGLAVAFDPLVRLLGVICSQLAILVSSFRLCVVNMPANEKSKSEKQDNCYC